MNILAALKHEQTKLQRQLTGIQGAIKVLTGGTGSQHTLMGRRRRVMSAAARAKISKATKARWARFRAEKARKAK